MTDIHTPNDTPLNPPIPPVIPTVSTSTVPESDPSWPTPPERLYAVAKASIGQDLTPGDQIPDKVACVAQIQEIFRKAFGSYVGTGPALYSTFYLLLALGKEFEEVSVPRVGDVAICATGTAIKNTVPHGHVAIVGNTHWMSNTSATGKWEANYTPATWKAYFETKGGYKTRYFRPVDNG